MPSSIADGGSFACGRDAGGGAPGGRDGGGAVVAGGVTLLPDSGAPAQPASSSMAPKITDSGMCTLLMLSPLGAADNPSVNITPCKSLLEDVGECSRAERRRFCKPVIPGSVLVVEPDRHMRA